MDAQDSGERHLMKIENSFVIDAPVDDAWALLTNIAEIAPCLPGAKLSGEQDGVYTGAVKIKVGPVTAEYRGTAEFVERDDTNYRAVIDGKGRDSRGAGNAQALISAAMHDVGGKTQVDITTDLKITGKVAQFGRGVMQDVSEKLLGQFAQCLATKLEGTTALEEIAHAGADDAGAGDLARAETTAGEAGEAGEGSVKPAGSSDQTPQLADPGSGSDAVGNSAKAPAAVGSAAVAGVAPGAIGSEDDDDALDLLDVAGGAVVKRLIPVAIALAALAVLLIVIFT